MTNEDVQNISRFFYLVAMAHMSVAKAPLSSAEQSAIIAKVNDIARGQVPLMTLQAVWLDAYATACADLDFPPWM